MTRPAPPLRLLVPGHASGPTCALSLAHQDALRRAAAHSPAVFPLDTRAGLLERLSAPNAPPRSDVEAHDARLPALPERPWVAWVAGLEALDVLALHRFGAAAVVLAHAAALEHHARVLAAALGLPLAQLTAPVAPAHRPLQLTLTPALSAAPPRPPLSLPPGARRVVPIRAVRPDAAHPPWLDLIFAQDEELHLAAALLRQGRASGVGLIRAEWLLHAEPDLNPDSLTARLTRIFARLKPWPVALRLPDWSPSKPPPSRLTPALAAWTGERGLDGMEPSLGVWRDVFGEAIARAAHPDAWVIAPHVGRPEHVARLSPQDAPWRLAAMVETPEAVANVRAYLGAAQGLWVGAGDLYSAAGEGAAALIRAAARAGLRDGHTVAVCGLMASQRWP